MIITKPHLACDYEESKLKFPYYGQPKIDGVRALNIGKGFTSRSLKGHENRHATEFFSHDLLAFLDGEAAAAAETDGALCRKTTSALSTIEGRPFILWHVFDDLRFPDLGYIERYHHLVERVKNLKENHGRGPWQHLRVVPSTFIKTIEELNEFDDFNLALGYEGSILRGLNSTYKNGRATTRENSLLRVKKFVDEEAIVLAIVEGESNQNEQTVNALGLSERSTHKANMVPNGMVGNLLCKRIKTGEEITVSPGNMPHSDRVMFFREPWHIVGKAITFKHFPKGVKDKLRFPTYKCIRNATDM